MLPNMRSTLKMFEQLVLLKSVETIRVDFVDDIIITTTPIRAVVQVADKKKLNLDSLDWSKQYIWVHSGSNMEIGQFIEWHGKDFKLVAAGDDYSDYGYNAWYGEETLQPVLVSS
ncbi:hypothetical protein vBVpPvVp04M_00033 [Vibrio phage vB_Vp_PvVp04_M]|nr:hypothetical protein vBVpPvVp04M_00033 [Vibrio phage vB_Vp_PvVp04_M]